MVDQKRRRSLIVAATVIGSAGAAAVAVPFIKAMLPSDREKAAGAPVDISIADLPEGGLITTAWRGKPVWVLQRTPGMLSTLADADLRSRLRDPDSQVSTQQPEYVDRQQRSIKQEYFVAIALCTHLGCIPTYRPDIAPRDLGPAWKGGFFCPCHGSRFDLAGRVYRKVPAPTNLVVPPHRYINDTVIRVGEDPLQS